MSSFIHKNFMLSNGTAEELFHESAEKLPIIDYHCHLIPKMIAENYQFRDITELWLGGDHYKWRAMRGNGVPEEYITGSRTPFEKFSKWAETVPYTMRNPLYHWTSSAYTTCSNRRTRGRYSTAATSSWPPKNTAPRA